MEMQLSIADLATAGRVEQLGFEPHRIDLMTRIDGVTFEEAWADRVSGSVGGVPVFFVALGDLIRNDGGFGAPSGSGRRRSPAALGPA